MRTETQVQFYQQFLEELSLRFEIALLTGHIDASDESHLAIITKFVKWVRDDVVDAAKTPRLKGSFMTEHALHEWKKIKPRVQQYPQDISDHLIARYLAGETDGDEWAKVKNTLGPLPLFQKLTGKIKSIFGKGEGD
jgi:hypothetical protein